MWGRLALKIADEGHPLLIPDNVESFLASIWQVLVGGCRRTGKDAPSSTTRRVSSSITINYTNVSMRNASITSPWLSPPSSVLYPRVQGR